MARYPPPSWFFIPSSWQLIVTDWVCSVSCLYSSLNALSLATSLTASFLPSLFLIRFYHSLSWLFCHIWVSSFDPILLLVMVHMFYFFSCVLCLVLSDMILDMVDFGLLSPRFHCTLIGFDLVLVCSFIFFVFWVFWGGKIILFIRFFPDSPSEFVSIDLSTKKVSYTLPGVRTAMKALQIRIWGNQTNSRQQVLLQAFSQPPF